VEGVFYELHDAYTEYDRVYEDADEERAYEELVACGESGRRRRSVCHRADSRSRASDG
jgi:hypothetical protein